MWEGVSFRNSKLPEISSNHAETPRVENAGKIGISVEKSSKILDRRISVAPMMDWTDALAISAT